MTHNVYELIKYATNILTLSPGDIISGGSPAGTTLQEHFDQRTVRSGNLYQIFAYLRTQEDRGEPYRSAEGMLLYPTAGYEVDERYEIQGHAIRVVTLDLSRTWQDVEGRLLAIVEDAAS